MKFQFKHAILGGTFDHLHLGHERFLANAFSQAEIITIGLVTSPLTSKPHAEQIEAYSVRQHNLINYLNHLNLFYRYQIIPLTDIYGTSLTDSSIEAVFITKSTQANAQLINDSRAKLSLPPLTLVTLPFAYGDDNQIISSSRIREGTINRLGHSYFNYFQTHKTYHLPDHLRAKLQEPLGTVTSDLSQLGAVLPKDVLIISVGDIVSINLKTAGYSPVVCIIDHQSRRTHLADEKITQYFPQIHSTLVNPAGTINPDFGDLLLASLTTYQKSHESQVIMVDGEEDLLALPAILLAPLGALIIYGQHNLGVCVIKITEAIKSLAEEYLSVMSQSLSN